MEINLSDHIREPKSLMGHLFLSGLTNTLKNGDISEFAEKNGIPGVGTVAEVNFFIDGIEIDLLKLITEWEKQVDRMVAKEAKELVRSQFVDISNLLYDLEGSLKVEIDKRLEDWEK